MNELMKVLEGNNLWLNLLFLILAILGIIATIITFLRSKKKKSCVFNNSTFNLIGDNLSSINELEVSFKNQKIKKLSTTLISIWNNGNDIINKSDFAPLEPLRIVASQDNIIIYDFKTKFIKNKANNFSINFEDKIIKIDFDYFAKNEGIVLQLYHNGNSSSDISIKGLIKGSSEISKGGFEEKKYVYKGFDIMLGWLDGLLNKVFPNSEKLQFIFLFPFFMLTLPVTFLLQFSENIAMYLNKIPKEYNLEDLNTSANNG